MNNEASVEINLKDLLQKISSYFEREEKEFIDTLEKQPFYCESNYSTINRNMSGALHFINSLNDSRFIELIPKVKEVNQYADYFPEYFRNNAIDYYKSWKRDKDIHNQRIEQLNNKLGLEEPEEPEP